MSTAIRGGPLRMAPNLAPIGAKRHGARNGDDHDLETCAVEFILWCLLRTGEQLDEHDDP